MEWFSQHMEQWSLVWFGLLFWGSIFGAALLYLFEANLVISVLGYQWRLKERLPELSWVELNGR